MQHANSLVLANLLYCFNLPGVQNYLKLNLISFLWLNIYHHFFQNHIFHQIYKFNRLTDICTDIESQNVPVTIHFQQFQEFQSSKLKIWQYIAFFWHQNYEENGQVSWKQWQSWVLIAALNSYFCVVKASFHWWYNNDHSPPWLKRQEEKRMIINLILVFPQLFVSANDSPNHCLLLEAQLHIICKTFLVNLQSFTKYLRLPLIFMWNSALQEKFNLCFLRVFTIIDKVLILAWRLCTRLSFYEVWTLSCYFSIYQFISFCCV